MKKDPKQIAEEIIKLVSELALLAGASVDNSTAQIQKLASSKKKDSSGPTGGIRLLAEEGKFDSPKLLSEVVDFLEQEGRHYGGSAVGMALMRLVRERVLTRLKTTGEKNWKYALRK